MHPVEVLENINTRKEDSMKVKKLIESLKKFNLEAEVRIEHYTDNEFKRYDFSLSYTPSRDSDASLKSSNNVHLCADELG